MSRKRKDDDQKITVVIHFGERTPQWDHLWECIFLDLPFTENDQAKKEDKKPERKRPNF